MTKNILLILCASLSLATCAMENKNFDQKIKNDAKRHCFLTTITASTIALTGASLLFYNYLVKSHAEQATLPQCEYNPTVDSYLKNGILAYDTIIGLPLALTTVVLSSTTLLDSARTISKWLPRVVYPYSGLSITQRAKAFALSTGIALSTGLVLGAGLSYLRDL